MTPDSSASSSKSGGVTPATSQRKKLGKSSVGRSVSRYGFLGFVICVVVLYFSVSVLHFSVLHQHDTVNTGAAGEGKHVGQGGSGDVDHSSSNLRGDATGGSLNHSHEELHAKIKELKMMIENENDRLDEIRAKMKKEKDSQKHSGGSVKPPPREQEKASIAATQEIDTADLQESAPLKVDHKQTKAALKSSSSMSAGGSMPGAQDRRILSMPLEDFRGTPVSQLMSHYGEAEGPQNCPGDFGNQLVAKWKATKKEVCRGTPGSSAGGGSAITSSTIDTYLIHQTRHHGDGDNLIHYKDVSVNMGYFANTEEMYKVVRNYVASRHFKQPYLQFPKGFIQGKCTPDKSRGWNEKFMPGWNKDLTTAAFEPIEEGGSAECDEWVDHPVLVVQRDTFANFFHDSEDFVNAFLALAVLDWKLGDTQVYLTDLYPEGPFWEMWKHAYSQGGAAKTVRTAWDLKKDFGGNPHNQKGVNHRVCFKDIAVGIYGPAAPITVASWDTPCKDTALVKAYADFVIRGMGLEQHTHYAEPTPSKTVTITYMARRASTVWPEKKFCSDSKSFFLCKLWDNFGIRSLGRMIKNDKDVAKALQSLEAETFKNGAKVKLSEVDFNLLSFPEQIKHDLRTDIMVGPHGAGLMHNIFMRPRATLIEIFIDGSGVNRHFHNLAFWSGHRYVDFVSQNPVNTDKLKGEVRKAVEAMDLSTY